MVHGPSAGLVDVHSAKLRLPPVVCVLTNADVTADVLHQFAGLDPAEYPNDLFLAESLFRMTRSLGPDSHYDWTSFRGAHHAHTHPGEGEAGTDPCCVAWIGSYLSSVLRAWARPRLPLASAKPGSSLSASSNSRIADSISPVEASKMPRLLWAAALPGCNLIASPIQ